MTYHNAGSSNLKLKSYGEYSYDNIIFFAPTVEKLGSITVDDITAFSNAGGNVLIAVSKDASDSVRDLTESFGIKLDKKGAEVIDHFEFVEAYDARYRLFMQLPPTAY